MLKITIPGKPICKKNNPRVFCINGCKGWRRGVPQPKKLVLPSEEYELYEKYCVNYLLNYGNIQYTEPVQVTCLYWFPNRRSRPDLGNLLAATSDILERAGILENDRLITSYDGSRIVGIDKDNPRAEITITKMGDL
jgi:Holliday junction resolvase RusA-like endonuclease